MSPKIIYNNEFIILKQNFEYFSEMKLLYLLFFINPKKLDGIVNIETKEAIDYFDSEYPIVRLFSQISIYENWTKMSLLQRYDFYSNVVQDNEDLCEIIGRLLEVHRSDSLINVLKNCQDIVRQSVKTSDPIITLLPIGKLSLSYENYYVLNSLKFDEANQNLYLSDELNLEFNEIFLYDYRAFGSLLLC